MSICLILDQKLDSRRNGDDCEFNGYLEDFLSLQENELDPVLREAFTTIQEKEPDTKICVGLRNEISRNAISNQIIRYKDVFKLNGKPMICPVSGATELLSSISMTPPRRRPSSPMVFGTPSQSLQALMA